jgi:hypothetical protein
MITCGLYANRNKTKTAFVWRVHCFDRAQSVPLICFFPVTDRGNEVRKGFLNQAEFQKQYPHKIQRVEIL